MKFFTVINRYLSDWIDRKNYLNFTVVSICCGIFLGAFRSADIFNSAHAMLLTDAITAFAIIVWSLYANSFKVRANASFYVLCAILLSGIGIGVLNQYPAGQIITDVSRPLMFFLVYTIFANASPNLLQAQKPSEWSMRLAVLSVFMTVVIFVLAYIRKGGLYLGLPSIYFVLPLLYYILKKGWGYTAFLILVLLCGGRRGTLIGFLFAALAWLTTRKISARNFTLLVFAAIFGLALIAWPNPFQDFIFNLGTIQKFVNNYNMANLHQSAGPLEFIFRMFDDRFSEILSALIDMSRSWTTVLFGRGFGFEYLLEYPYRDVLPDFVRGVHFSPLGIYAHFGLVGFIFVYAFLGRVLVRSMKALHLSQNPVIILMALFNFAYFMDTFSGFSIFITPIFAISCGMVMNPNAFEI